ncbi:MAG: hypothetical protein ACXW5U_06850 [Thermoanaerobaculia bacterium]
MSSLGSSSVATFRSRTATSPHANPPNITLLPISWLKPSEGIDPRRASEVRRQLLLDEGILQPLQVALLNSRFILLDGHNRLHALRQLRLRHAPVQIHRGDIDARTWVLTSSSELADLAELEKVKEPVFSAQEEHRGGLVGINDGTFRLFPSNDRRRLRAQHAVVRALSRIAGQALARHEDADREEPRWWTRLRLVAPAARTLLIYPRIAVEEFYEIVINRRQKVPAGATRFRLDKVLLDAPLPLSLFSGWHPLREARLRLADALAQRSFSLEVPR